MNPQESPYKRQLCIHHVQAADPNAGWCRHPIPGFADTKQPLDTDDEKCARCPCWAGSPHSHAENAIREFRKSILAAIDTVTIRLLEAEVPSKAALDSLSSALGYTSIPAPSLAHIIADATTHILECKNTQACRDWTVNPHRRGDFPTTGKG